MESKAGLGMGPCGKGYPPGFLLGLRQATQPPLAAGAARSSLHTSSSHDQPARLTVVQSWNERAAQAWKADAEAAMMHQSNQAAFCQQLTSSPSLDLESDPKSQDVLLGRRLPALPDNLSSNPGLVRALQLLHLQRGDGIELIDPPSVQWLVSPAAMGHRCLVQAEQANALRSQLFEWLGRVDATPAEKAMARSIAARIHTSRLGMARRAEGLRAVFVISSFARMSSLAQARATVDAAGQRLAEGGGLVFEFLHAASSPMHPQEGIPLMPSLADFADVARARSLQLKILHVDATPIGDESAQSTHTRLVLPADSRGALDPSGADQAVWQGWNAILGNDRHNGTAFAQRVSGVFVKQAS